MEAAFGSSMERFYCHARNQIYPQTPMDGNAVVLNFINTNANPQQTDHLTCYDDFLCWCRMAEMVDESFYHHLLFEAYCSPMEAKESYAAVCRAREMLSGLFNALLAKQTVQLHLMGPFKALAATVLKHIDYDYIDGCIQRVWQNTDDEFEAPLWFIVQDAMELLARPDLLLRLKKCAGCGSLYLDTSKCKTRSWCNPYTCGKRGRNRRYYKGSVSANGTIPKEKSPSQRTAPVNTINIALPQSRPGVIELEIKNGRLVGLPLNK